MQQNFLWICRLGAIVLLCGLGLSGCGSLYKSLSTMSDGGPPPPRILTASDFQPKAPPKSIEIILSAVPVTSTQTLPNAEPTAQTQTQTQTGTVVTPDQCWAQMVVYPRKEISTQKVITKDGRLSYDVQQAALKTIEEFVTIRDGATSYKVEPPQYKMTVEQVKVKDEIKKIVVNPAIYKDEEDTVMTVSPRIEIRSCRAAGKRVVGPRQPMASQAQCTVSIPAKYKTITRKVLVEPETLTEVITPAVYESVTKWTLVENGKALSVEIPPEKIKNTVLTVNAPAQATPLTIPPLMSEYQVTNYDGAPQLTWRQLVCAKDASPSMVEKLQAALIREGFQLGPIDGKLGNRTMKAIESYQLQKGIASGFLTYETLDILGLQK